MLTPELRERAVRMVEEVRASHGSQWAVIEAVATKLGIGWAETLRIRVRQAEVDTGARGEPTIVCRYVGNSIDTPAGAMSWNIFRNCRRKRDGVWCATRAVARSANWP